MGKKDCKDCGIPAPTDDQIKKMEQMMKNKVAPCECPLKGTCTKKVLKDEAEVLCKDQETSQEAMVYHMNAHHVWENCKTYREKKIETEGKLPRHW